MTEITIIEPDVTPEVPAFKDEEIDEATAVLGMRVMRASQIRQLRTLGQSVRTSGVLSIGRGMIMFTTGHLMDLMDTVKQEADQCVEEEVKVKHRALQATIAKELNNSAKILLESEPAPTPPPLPPPVGSRLPGYGEQVGPANLTQINTDNVHIHSNG